MPVPLIALAAGALLLAGGVWGYRAGRRTLPAACRGKLRVWVVGPTGAGKTLLTRAVLGRPLPAAPGASPSTARLEWHCEPDHPLALADTVGLELVRGPRQVREMLSRLGGAGRPHAAWICVRAGGDRVFGADPTAREGTEVALAELLMAEGVPCLGVLTQADLAPEGSLPMEAALREAMPGLRAVVPVCVAPRLDEDGTLLVPRHGLDRLRQATIAALEGGDARLLEERWPAAGW